MEIDVKKLREGRGLTQQALADLIGVHINTVQNWESGKKIPNTKYPILCSALGYEEMQGINISYSPHSNVATGQGQININGPQPVDDQTQEEEMIPVIPTNIYKETDLNIYDYVTNEENDVQMSPAIQQFPKTDMFYTVNTKAMYPDIHQGDILALKLVCKNKTLVNGEVYAIDTASNGILVRYAYDRGDRVELRPSEEAERFETIYVEKEDIFNYFRVVGLVRTNI